MWKNKQRHPRATHRRPQTPQGPARARRPPLPPTPLSRRVTVPPPHTRIHRRDSKARIVLCRQAGRRQGRRPRLAPPPRSAGAASSRGATRVRLRGNDGAQATPSPAPPPPSRRRSRGGRPRGALRAAATASRAKPVAWVLRVRAARRCRRRHRRCRRRRLCRRLTPGAGGLPTLTPCGGGWAPPPRGAPRDHGRGRGRGSPRWHLPPTPPTPSSSPRGARGRHGGRPMPIPGRHARAAGVAAAVAATVGTWYPSDECRIRKVFVCQTMVRRMPIRLPVRKGAFSFVSRLSFVRETFGLGDPLTKPSKQDAGSEGRTSNIGSKNVFDYPVRSH